MVMDVRVRREPLQATPHLFQTPVILSEARGTIELPFVSVLHLRGFGRYGQLAAPDEVNERTTWGGGPTLQLPAGVELNSSYARTAYARPTTAGYFAPQRVDALDAGLYAEPSPWGPFSLVVDVGGGAERVTRYSADDSGGGILSGGDWQPALRLWMQASWALGAVGEIRVEVEAYQTQMADAVTSDASMWRWGSLGLSTVWRP
jgi:hypothetical protein